MSALEMQSFLARLYIDDPFRRLFALQPDALLDEYKLTSEERAALKALDGEAVEHFARGLKRKRRGRVSGGYPLLMDRLKHPDIERLYDRYYQLFPDDPAEPILQQGQRFGRFMEESLAGDPDVPPYAAELARYERLLLAVNLEPETEPTELSTGPLPLDSVPSLRPDARADCFRFDLPSIARELQEGRVPDAVSASEHFFIIHKRPGRRRPSTLRAVRETFMLLQLCDGMSSVAEIVAAYEHQSGEVGLQAEVCGGLEHLRDQAVLRVRAPRQG